MSAAPPQIEMSPAAEATGSAAWVLLATTAVVLVYLYAPYWKVRRIPGPPLVPLIGHLHLLAKHGPDVFSFLAGKYGPIYRFHLGRQPLVIVADPELCKEVGIRKFKSIMNRSLPSPISGSPLHQKGLFFTRDSRWSAMRNTIISLYQPSHLATLIPTMQTIIETAFLNLDTEPNEDITFSDISLKLATDIIAQAAFGVDLGLSTSTDDQVSSFVDLHVNSTTSLKMDLSGSFSVVLGMLAPILQGPFRLALKRIPNTVDWKIDRVNGELARRLNLIVDRRAREENTLARRDFLSEILKARNTGGAAAELFTADYVSALTYEHLLAGSTTTSFTLASVLYLVAGHPRVEQRLLEEIDAFSPSDTVPTADDLQIKLPYLDQVIKEAMRFYTVSPLVARETSEGVEIGGRYLPKGTWIWLALGVLAKDPAQFPEPEEFRPERFDPASDEEKRRHPYANIPFGIGPRACIGRRFSLQEIKLAAVYLYRKYVFRRSPCMESPLALEYGFVLGFKHGVKLRVLKR